MSETSLVCSCGMTLKAAGARPGRVGKCPRCGSMIRVPDDFAAPPRPRKQAPAAEAPAGGYVLSRDDAHAPSSFQKSPAPALLGTQAPARTKLAEGPVAPPAALETRFRASLAYPLWGWSSVAILVAMPPILTLTSAPLKLLIDLMLTETLQRVLGLIWLIVGVIFGVMAWGYVLAFLSDVLISSARGESLPPRLPDPVNDDLFRTMRRWFWALVSGLVVGVAPAVAFWIHCGDVDPVEWAIFFSILIIGASYAQMALVAALLHDDPLAANPITVLSAIGRVGWEYVAQAVMGGCCLGALGGLIILITRINDLMILGPLAWLFWTLFLYAAMVVLRRLGLFCHRQREALGWFRIRPTWGR